MSQKKKCPQCKNLMLITAPTCLYCGRPNKFVTNDYINAKWDKRAKDRRPSIFPKIVFFLLILAFIILIFRSIMFA